MISPYEKRILEEILNWNDVDEAIDYLMAEYAKKGAANALHLLSRIGDIASVQVAQSEKRVVEYSQAAHWLMAQRELKPDKSGTFFATLLPVCKIMFPNGNADGYCEAEQRYFRQFLEAFSDKNQFRWDRDRTWADMYGYTEYLQLIERKMNKNG